MKKLTNFDFRHYVFRVLIVNFLSFIYLSKTYAFDVGFFSIQSFIYSINIYLIYFFIFLESVAALINEYGLDFNAYKLLLNNFGSLNYYYVGYILYENINILYFLFFSAIILFFFETTGYKINIKLYFNSIKQKIYFVFFIIVFILSNIIPTLSYNDVIQRIKGVTKIWSENDRIFFNEIQYYYQNVKNNFFRNDNWYYTLKFTIAYSNNLHTGSKKIFDIDKNEYFGDFEKIITEKYYNNIYVIINESYPNFRSQILKDNLFQRIVLDNKNLKVQKFKKKWNRSITTQGAEMDFFCDKEVDYDNFRKKDLEEFLKRNNCWIYNIKNKNLTYIHSYKESFFNRTRYKNFFNKSYFKEDLYLKGFKNCKQKFHGICDHEVINNMDKLIHKKNDNFVIFLTVNNHVPAEPITKKKYINCEKVFPLNLSKQFCIIYNNQMFFNESLSKFLSNMGKDDLVVLFSDTPPMFAGKRRIHFEDLIDIYFFSKN